MGLGLAEEDVDEVFHAVAIDEIREVGDELRAVAVRAVAEELQRGGT